ncbi:MAG: hypothetical protein H6682_12825 [Candidatus Eisenbacteria bacterium]|nr:hypothetical protein [Candidatus Eisenbacteria bacterium]
MIVSLLMTDRLRVSTEIGEYELSALPRVTIAGRRPRLAFGSTSGRDATASDPTREEARSVPSFDDATWLALTWGSDTTKAVEPCRDYERM